MIAVRRLLASSLGFWIILAFVVAYFLYPISKRLQYGIDIVGGTYMTLGVKTNEAVAYDLQSVVQAALHDLHRREKIDPVATKLDNEAMAFVVSFANAEQALKAQTTIENEYASKQHRAARDLVFALNNAELTVKMSEAKQNEIRSHALVSNQDILRTRLNTKGVEETPVYIRGNDRIVVELPNVHDQIEAKKIIGTPAMLEFRLVEAGPASSREELLDKFDGAVPEGMEIVDGHDTHEEGIAYYLVPNYTEVTGRYLLNAKPKFVQDNRGEHKMAVEFDFNAEGGEKFHELTAPNIGRFLATLLDKKVVSNARIESAIGRHGMITGYFSQDAAKELATLLKSGAYTAPVTFEEERHIGPALGSDSIKRGLLACLIGLALLFAFSVLYYKLSGLFAFIVLLYNLLLLLFMLSQIGAKLTLPGIAALALTVGMAIDSSILIFERTKEMLRQGASIPAAVRQGFSGSLSTILDANITTLIVGIILYNFGSGPVKGFATNIVIGIFTTLTTGLLVLRSIFEYLLSRHIQKLSI
jgi:preprotein translocase subunit SecD